MNTIAGRTLGLFCGVAPSLLLPASRALADSTPAGGSMMGNGYAYGHMHGYGGPWLIALIVVVVGAVLVVALRRTK